MSRLPVAAALLLLSCNRRPADPTPQLPRLMLWAWESPQDLRFVRSEDAGIAFLARTVFLTPDGATSRPRLQPLRYTPGTSMVAVVRLESPGGALPSQSDAVREVLPAARLAGIRAVQIDFDARRSQRAWYAAFLGDLRRSMPQSLPLVITALESWCDGDRWMRELPVADATPMLFRMGRGERIPGEFREPLCRSSLGLSTNEVPASHPPAARLYVFHPGSWNEQSYALALRLLR